MIAGLNQPRPGSSSIMKRLKARLHAIAMRWLFRLRRLRPATVAETFRWASGLVATIRRRRRAAGLTVAVDISAFWEPLTGIGWYLYRILENLADEEGLRLRLYGPVIVDADTKPVVEPPRGPAIETVIYPLPLELTIPPYFLHKILHKLRPLLIAADGNRVLFAPNYLLPRTFAFTRGPVVATVHDLGFRKVPWTLQKETLEHLEQRFHKALARARHLLTPSEAVRREILEENLCPRDRVTAIHHGPGQLAEEEAGELPEGTPEAFALHVGTIEPRKNLKVLLEAWPLLQQEGEEPLALVLCGRLGWASEDAAPLLAKGEAEGWLFRPGYVDNPQLAALYRKARCVVFPSLYEGFGLPAVEAQWAGTPLLCSDIPVLREVTGGAALFLPPEDPEAWAEALRQIQSDSKLRKDLKARGRAHAAQLSWEQAAASTLAAWQQAASRD